jgi:hypothetical protein
VIQLTDRSVSPGVKHAHDALKEKLGKINTTFIDREISADEIREVLHEFHNVLAVHFYHENEECLVQSATARVPKLRVQARHLCAEYREIVHKASDLYRFALTGSPSIPWWRELKTRCRDFTQQLQRHEDEESSLLKQAQQKAFASTV